MSKASELIKEWVKSYDVLVLSKSWCPYCSSAKNTLNQAVKATQKTIKVVELDKVENGEELQKAGTESHGVRTVPQIWVNHKFVGGNSDLEARLRGFNVRTQEEAFRQLLNKM